MAAGRDDVPNSGEEATGVDLGRGLAAAPPAGCTARCSSRASGASHDTGRTRRHHGSIWMAASGVVGRWLNPKPFLDTLNLL